MFDAQQIRRVRNSKIAKLEENICQYGTDLIKRTIHIAPTGLKGLTIVHQLI